MDFSAYPLWINLLVFAVAAALVWGAGTRVTAYVDELGHRHHLSQAFLGLFLLSTISSLPEIATSFTAALHANSDLAVNNLLGSIALQIALLAVADLVIGKQALTAVVPDALVLLQGSLNIVLLALVTVAITVGDIRLFGTGAWSWGLIGTAAYSACKLVQVGRHRKPWVINPDDAAAEDVRKAENNEMPRKNRNISHALLHARLGLAILTILLAGAMLAYSGEAIGMQSGLGQSFAGMALVAAATSLPEISTVFTSMRAGLYTMAISDILGTNILNVALIGGVDLVDRSRAVLDEAGSFPALAAMLGILMTGLFMAGLSERDNRTYLRMGIDSILVLIAYVGGMILLFQIRES
jgi:cation:H+ antiporter